MSDKEMASQTTSVGEFAGSVRESQQLTSKDDGAVSSSATPAVPPTRYDLQILRSTRRIIRAVDIYSRKLRAKFQLTAPQLICLSSVNENGSTTVSHIAKDVFLSPSTVVGILDRLEQRGLITRERDTEDRRVVNVRCTDEGNQVVREAPSVLQDNLAESLRQLPELEQATIALSLQRIVNLMEASHLEAAPILETDQPDLTASSGESNSTTKEREIREKSAQSKKE